MVLMAALTAIYVFFGGYFATALTDFVQGIIMISGVVILGTVIVNSPSVGGLSNGFTQLGDKASPFYPFGDASKGGVLFGSCRHRWPER
jgi:SSS family solute:Na+ symporter